VSWLIFCFYAKDIVHEYQLIHTWH
jgi:hypothetical protein